MRLVRGLALTVALAPGFLAASAVVDSSAMAATAARIVAVKDSDSSSEADKRARAVECSKQADAKHLHGEARMKFRAACKDKSST